MIVTYNMLRVLLMADSGCPQKGPLNGCVYTYLYIPHRLAVNFDV